MPTSTGNPIRPGTVTCITPSLANGGTALTSRISFIIPYLQINILMGYPALDLTNKTAVVIGGTSGIGLALAKGLAQAGADVIATGRRTDLVKSVAESIRAVGRRSLPITSDVTDRTS